MVGLNDALGSAAWGSVSREFFIDIISYQLKTGTKNFVETNRNNF
ncbi:MAG TPA: hypothetical protein PLZ68_05660 [Ferruginibacter sp.]|nr:hypothetical protein [Ferruginibacter sp.]